MGECKVYADMKPHVGTSHDVYVACDTCPQECHVYSIVVYHNLDETHMRGVHFARP